jgi:hypothetical protein
MNNIPTKYLHEKRQSSPKGSGAKPLGPFLAFWRFLILLLLLPVQYTYDAVGNRLSMTNDRETIEYTYNKVNQLLQAGNTSYNLTLANKNY